MNNEFRFSLPLTKPPKKVHESYYKFMNLDRYLFFNYGLWRLNDYYDDSLFMLIVGLMKIRQSYMFVLPMYIKGVNIV